MGNIISWFTGRGNSNQTKNRTFSQTSSPNPANINRIFLVGNAAVGKTTLIKQMQKLCYMGNRGYEMMDSNWDIAVPFKHEERKRYRHLVYANVLKSIATLILQVRTFGLKFDSEERERFAREILDYTTEDLDSLKERELQINREMARKIESLWQLDSGIESAWKRRREFTLLDSTQYFLRSEKLQEIASPHYIPTVDDILRVRNPTDKPTDFNFRINRVRFNIHDAGGQTEQRIRLPDYLRHWLADSRPGDKNFILFVASLSDYNQRHPTFRDSTLLDESINLLKILLCIDFLKDCGFMLFLNKRDILLQKTKSFNDFDHYFHQYIEQYGLAGRRLTLEQSEKIVAARFADAVRESPRSHDHLYCKFTCAIDTGLMEGIFAIIQKDIIDDMITGKTIFP